MHKQFDLIPALSAQESRFESVSGSVSLGSVHTKLNCFQLSAAGDCLVFTLPQQSDGGASCCVLELDELHGSADAPFAYELLLDGKLLAVRTMEPLSSALCPFYLALPAGRSGGTLTIRSISDTPVRFASMYLHSDLSVLTSAYASVMEIGMCFLKLTFSDQKSDLAYLQKMRHDTADLEHFRIAAGIEIKYMNLNDAELSERFHYSLDLAAEAGIGLIFNFNSWWDGTPVCRDGKGGYLHDAEYQQVVYDPKTGRLSLSIPNLWRNTPWLTMNHPQLNHIRRERLRAAMHVLRRVHAERLRAEGSVPSYRILIDNEPTYWSQYAYCQSPECGGDFNENCIRAAAQDGVELSPVEPLGLAQREWMIGDLSRYISDVASVFHDCAAEEYSVEHRGRTLYTEHALAENVFTHVMPYSGYPLADDRHWQYGAHVTPHVRLGIEVAGFQDPRLLSYASATGRWSQVNAERCCYTDPRFHHQIYCHGAVCDILFNCFYEQDIAHLHQLDRLDAVTLPEPVYGTPVMHFCAYTQELTGGTVAGKENMAVAPLRERRVLRPAQLGNGSITFCIGSASRYPFGGWLELLCLSRPLNGAIRLEIGTAPDCMQPLLTLPEHDADYQRIPLRAPLPERLVKTGGALYIRLCMELRYYDDWAQMNAVWDIRSVAAFPEEKAPARPLLLPEYRALSTLTALRQDCKRLLTLFPEADSTEIRADMETGDYQSAYAQLMHAVSVRRSVPFRPSEAAAFSEQPKTLTATFLGYSADTGTLRFCTHDAGYSAYQDHLTLPCAQDVPVTLRASRIAGELLEHISTNPYTPAAITNARLDPSPTVFSLKTGDMLELSLQDGAVRSITAVRGLARGRLVGFEPMRLSAPMHNAFLTLEVAPDERCRFELGMQTRLNYVNAPAAQAMLCGESALNLELGSVLLVSFEPETAGAHPYRALEITVV